MPVEHRFDVDGMTLAAQAWGDPRAKPVLALHGWLDNSASFARVAPQLRDTYLVSLDLAGHGHSDHRCGSGPYNIWEDVGDLFSVADQLGWKQFSLLGHSRGGIISMIAAGTFPQRITQLAVIEGLWPERPRPEDAPEQLAHSIVKTRALAHRPMTLYPSIDAAVQARQAGMFPLSPRAARALTERGLKAQDGGYRWSSDQRLLAPSAVHLTETHLRAFLNRCRCDFLLLLGEGGVPEFFSNYREALTLFPPQLQVEMLPGGHHLHMEAEAPQVAAQLNAFFDH